MPAWLEKLIKRDKAAPRVPVAAPDAGLRARALALRDAGKPADAEPLLRGLLQAAPDDVDLHYQLGVALQMQARNDAAKSAYAAVLGLDPGHADANNNLGVILKSEGRLEEALGHHLQALRARPGSVDALNNIAVALQALGRTDESLPYFDRALALQPAHAGLRFNKAAALQALGRLDEAIVDYRQALQLQPALTFAYRTLGDALLLRGRLDEAEQVFRKALSLLQPSAELHYGLGAAELGSERVAQAFESFGKALALRPNYPEAMLARGVALKELGRFADARRQFAEALQLAPAYAEAWDKLGSLHRDQGELAEAMECYRKALQVRPDFENADHNLCFAMNYAEGVGQEEIFDQHLAFARRHAAFSVQAKFPNRPEAGRRLRLGYVSGDFRKHAISQFIDPVLARHDRAGYEVFCYYNFFRDDIVTERLRGHADHWRNIYGVNDADAARMIASDGIDILIDLSGHTGLNRLTLFARKPAPVQACFLGYPATSGLAAMDYRITDRLVEPDASYERYYTETLARMPDSMWCYQPPANAGGVPPRADGPIRFGSLNNYSKVGTEVMALWARLLREIPAAQLVMITVPPGSAQQRLRERFAELGVGADRLELHGRLPAADFQNLGSGIDIALDPFPCGGGTTTCETLWMGVPVITLVGNSFLARAGFSLLSAVGLAELAAPNADSYVEIAACLARDLPRLAELRAGMRARMLASPLCDAARYTRNLEALYRQMWTTWCAKQ